jgi:hypothetical protein
LQIEHHDKSKYFQKRERHLLEKEKRALVVSSLPHLQQRFPRLFGGDVSAALALHGFDLEINDKTFLHNCILKHLLMHASDAWWCGLWPLVEPSEW